MVVGLAETVANARSRVGAHAAAAGRVVEIVPGPGIQHLAVSSLRQLLKELLEMIAREAAARFRGGVQTMLDLGQRIAETVLRGRIERQRTLAVGMHIVIAANARRSALRALPPIRHQAVSEQDFSIGASAAAARVRRRFPTRADRAAQNDRDLWRGRTGAK